MPFFHLTKKLFLEFWVSFWFKNYLVKTDIFQGKELHVLAHTTRLVSVQIDHHQLIFILRLAEELAEMAGKYSLFYLSIILFDISSKYFLYKKNLIQNLIHGMECEIWVQRGFFLCLIFQYMPLHVGLINHIKQLVIIWLSPSCFFLNLGIWTGKFLLKLGSERWCLP